MPIALIIAMRPSQALKNGLVLVPLLFSVNIWFSADDPNGMAIVIARGIAAAVIFSFLSGAVYLLNDLADADRDRSHPVKRSRPIASGALGVRAAYVAAIVFIILSMAVAGLVSVELFTVAFAYLLINIAYTLWLKHYVLLDVMSVAAGFVLRALAGAVVIDGASIVFDGVTTIIDITISPWLYIVTALGATLLALAKRRAELEAAGDNAVNQRDILSEYSLGFLDMLIGTAAASSLIAYTLYTFSLGDSGANVPSDNSMMLTIPFVAYGIFRYLYLLYVKGGGEKPEEILLKDGPTIVNITLWLAASAAILLWHTLN